MKALNRSRLGFDLKFTIAAALFATILALLVTEPFGVGISPDSVAYISAARNLITDGSLRTFDSEPLVSWPPAFPVLIAIPGLIGSDVLEAARFTNVIIFGLIVLVGSLLLARMLEDRRLILLGTGMLALSEPLMTVCTRAWSEPLFVLVTTVFLVAFQEFMDTNDSKSLGLALVMAAFAPLIRYIGVTAIASAGILLLLQTGPRFSVRLRRAILFVGIAVVPIALWLFRNHAVSGTLTGPRAQTEITLLRNAGSGIGTLCEWFLPSALGMTLFLWKIGIPARTESGFVKPIRTVMIPAVFACVYILTLALSVAFVGIDVIDHRLLSPVYVPLLVVILAWIDRRRSLVPSGPSQADRKWLIIAICLWLLWPVVDTGIRAVNYSRNGIRTYSTRAWFDSDLMRRVAELPSDVRVFSNAPDAIYIHTDRAALYSPYKREELTLANSERRLGRFLDHLQSDSIAYLAAFTTVKRQYLYSADEIASQCHIEPVAEYSDGTLYRLSSLRKKQ